MYAYKGLYFDVESDMKMTLPLVFGWEGAGTVV
jgi:Zn-dependent alcohol dehydrogenase